MQVQNKETERDQRRLKRLWRPVDWIHANTKLYGETERSKETKETKETVETEDTCKDKIKRQRSKETEETVTIMETGDTCKYKIKRQRDQRRLKRLWRPVEIHKFYGEIETKAD